MANTTNYNWETPDDTDLVKDGAAAIRTLGSSIDTTTKALNPSTTLGDIEYRSSTANTNTRLGIGSTGQVLTVAGGVPSWATPTAGDIEGVTAGTGISGGGTSGTVTITNSMATAIDAKGDLVVGTGADTFSRLAVGTNDYVLTAASGETTGLKWAAPASGGGMTLLDTLTLSGASTVTSSTFSSAYNQIFIYIKGAYSASGAPWLNLRINGDSGSNYSNRYIIGEGTSVFVNGNNSTTEYPMGTVTTSTSDPEKAFAYITIMKPSDTDIFFISSECQSFTVGQSTRNWQSTGTYDASAALTSITIFTTVNFSGGTAAIYGVK